MNHYVLTYELAPDYLQRRGQFRNEHLRLGWEASERGELVLGGPLPDPFDLALLIFRSDSPRAAEEFARKDPYVINGLVKSWRVRPWTTAIGATALNPIHPT
jgi:uncharacterized protein